MCKVGDIILVNNYKHGDIVLSKHSFVVLDTDGGEIYGMEYDMVCNVMSSFYSQEQEEKKLSYSGNFGVKSNEMNTKPHNGKNAYIKANQMYYFKQDQIQFRVIGNLEPETMETLVGYINELAEAEQVYNITDNLQSDK